MRNNEKDNLIFCENIRNLRAREGLSKREMAEKLGLGVYSLTKVENNIIPPRMRVDVLSNIHRQFGITPSQIFTEG